MPENKIIQLGDANPSREVLEAAAQLLNAVIRQYPRAGADMRHGVAIRIVTANGALMEIAGAAGPTFPPVMGNGGIAK